ncbi:UTRA domain-containing protein [Streptosporangium sp. NBC_01756]|uniref:UTRA domain-containing protein n=1 Tax=Streptosporangium sp. NBC_01756 TaxID=2975950 RepID=UPI003FA381C8
MARVVDRDIRAGAAECAGDSGADTGRGAGDDGDAVGGHNSARAATPTESALLDLDPGVPVLCVIRTTIASSGAAAGRVVEVNVTRRDASRFEVGYPITRRQ